MNIDLAAIGWIDDCDPFGNRLRWTYPYGKPDTKGGVLGLPESFVIDRTLVKDDIEKPQTAVAPDGQTVVGSLLNYPASWWSPRKDLQLSDWFTFCRLPRPVQAVRFTYIGPDSQIRIHDRANRSLLLDRPIRNNEHICFTAPLIDEISFIALTSSVTLQGLQTLDLFTDRGLEWQTIATIHPAETFRQRAGLNVVAARCGKAPTLSSDEWDNLVQLVQEALVVSPSTTLPKPVNMREKPLSRDYEALPPWRTLEVALGIRWEFSCLAGFGFYDGPRLGACPLDHIDAGEELRQRPRTAVAYRVRCDDRRVNASNIVVCPPYSPGPVRPPSVPTYLRAIARLTSKGAIEADTKLQWIQHDFNAIGVEIKEEITERNNLGTSPRIEIFECQSVDPSDLPFTGSISRRFEVASHDVTLKVSARALDGWDRSSAFSPRSNGRQLDLRHAPFPPTLALAGYAGGIVTIELEPASAGVPAWQPDPIVKAENGKIGFHRRDPSKALKKAGVTLSGPSLANGDSLYKSTLMPDSPGTFQPGDYAGGTVVVGTMRLGVLKITSTEVYYECLIDAGNTAPAFSGGKGTIYPDMNNPDLWVKMHEQPAEGLCGSVQFNEPLAFPTEWADVLQYACRIEYGGRMGPMSNIVSFSRIPLVPDPPPAFAVELQGVDFYDRTMIKLTLTSPAAPDARFKVAWALGDQTATQNPTVFSKKAVAGLYGPQRALNQRVLYDLLPLPLNKQTRRLLSTVTIGVQQVNACDGESDFSVVKV